MLRVGATAMRAAVQVPFSHPARLLMARSMSSFSSNNIVRDRPLPVNTIVKFVPQQEVWIVERFGKFHRMLKPGLNVLLPFIDRISYVQSLKEIVIEIPTQAAISNGTKKAA